ncbi:MAG: hypothetical protein ACOX8Q_01500 [Christensenellales bacterium]|jgi:hypothetical protein
MVCPNCGGRSNGNICIVCGNILSRPRKHRTIAFLCISLAIIIVACAVLFFILPSRQSYIGTAAKNYLTAAYCTDKIINSAHLYSSYNDFKKDLNIAIECCSAIQGGVFDFLASIQLNLPFGRIAYAAETLKGIDTDVKRDYSGGYTDGAKKNIENWMMAMRKDAIIAKAALEELNGAINRTSGEDKILGALSDAKEALSDANNVKIVVGDKQISLNGINDVEGINTALIGADMIIDNHTLYLGTDGSAAFYCDVLRSNVTVVNSNKGDGIIMDAKNLADRQAYGDFVVITFYGLDEEPKVLLYTNSERQQFIDKISDIISFKE